MRLASGLRAHAGGASRVDLDVAAPVTVAAVLDALAEAHPAVGRRVRDEAGSLRPHVNVFVGVDNFRDLDDVDTVVPDGTEVAVLAAVSGGCACLDQRPGCGLPTRPGTYDAASWRST